MSRKLRGEQCPAKSKTSGEQCKNRVVGGGVCRNHGGASPQARAGREARILRMQAEAYGGTEARTPAEALLAAGRSLDYTVQALESMARDKGLTSALLKEVREAARESGRMAKLIQDAGLDERRVRLEEVQQVQVGQVLRLAAGALGLRLADAEVRSVLSEALARVEAGDFTPLPSRSQAVVVVGE